MPAVLTLLALATCSSYTDDTANEPAQQTFTKPIVINDSLVVLRPEEGLVYYLGKPFTGTAVSLSSNGKTVQSIDYSQGKREGYYRKWFANGQLSYESLYTNGKQDGLTRSWWNNGKLRTASHFLAGVAHGLQKQWYSSGAKFKHIRLVNGQEEGLQQSWRENGKVYNNYEAKNGRIFGLKRANLCYQLDDEVVQYKSE